VGDQDVRSPGFLDVTRYPRLQLRSRSVRQVDGGRLAIDAELILHGVSSPLSLLGSILPPGPGDGDGVARIRIVAGGGLDRRRFAIPRRWVLGTILGRRGAPGLPVL